MGWNVRRRSFSIFFFKYFKRKNFLFQYGIGIAFDFQDFKYLSFALFRPFIWKENIYGKKEV